MSQCEMVIEHLERHGSITPLDAIYGYGITRLSDVIYKLKKKGFVIDTEMESAANRYGECRTYARYVLRSKPYVKESRG